MSINDEQYEAMNHLVDLVKPNLDSLACLTACLTVLERRHRPALCDGGHLSFSRAYSLAHDFKILWQAHMEKVVNDNQPKQLP